MKVLVITRNAWDDTNAIGNTLSNFFMGIDDIDFASIYFRSASPNNKVCEEYYRVTETEVLKKWFSPKKIGKRFFQSPSFKPAVQTATQKNEKAVVQFIRDHNLNIAYWLSDRVWYSKKWQNKNLSEFIRSFAPDIAVTFVKSSPQYYLTVRYLREKFNIPVLSWIADDEYTGLLKKNARREISNLKYILDESAIVRGCSQKICDYYNSVFGCEATPLYKGCDLSTPVKDSINKPLKIVYAGNLLYGRMDIIHAISEIIESYDPKGQKVSFEIYSNTALTSDEMKCFEKLRCSDYLGCLDYDLIKQKLAAADVVLHVESFENEQILKTKYSFSTKIIDCLQSGSVMLAIGPGEIASIEYIKQIPGACVIDRRSALEAELLKFLEDTSSFSKRAGAIREFACKNHDYIINSKELESALKKVTGRNS